jgi:hypothetical protein
MKDDYGWKKNFITSWINEELFVMYATYMVESLLGSGSSDYLIGTAIAKRQHVLIQIEALQSPLVRCDDVGVSMRPRDSLRKNSIGSHFQQMQLCLPLGGLLYGC